MNRSLKSKDKKQQEQLLPSNLPLIIEPHGLGEATLAKRHTNAWFNRLSYNKQ